MCLVKTREEGRQLLVDHRHPNHPLLEEWLALMIPIIRYTVSIDYRTQCYLIKTLAAVGGDAFGADKKQGGAGGGGIR